MFPIIPLLILDPKQAFLYLNGAVVCTISEGMIILLILK